MKIVEHKSIERSTANFGWFKAKYSFSFGQWYKPDKLGFGALRVFNDSIIQPNKGFPEHPHDNMEVITVQLQGKLSHTDVSGTRIIQAGDVQVITAGSGVTHSDLNIGDEEAKQFQIWIHPDKRNLTPQSNIAHFLETDRYNKWQVLASPHGDDSSCLHLQQTAWLSRGAFEKGITTYKMHNSSNGVYVFVIDGEIELENYKAATRDALGLTEINSVLEFNCIEKTDVLVIEVPMGL